MKRKLFIMMIFLSFSGITFCAIDSSIVEPHFSIKGGFYNTSVYLTLTSSHESGKIFYTTDGSEPAIKSNEYLTSIFINKTVVIRAKCFINDSISSPTETNTFFIDEKFTLPVISISTDPKNFWDPDSGIYVMGKHASITYPYWGANFWQDWERPVHIELYEPDGEQAFSINAGVKIFGEWSRAFPQKSLSVFARKKYGDGKIKYRIFPDLPIDKFESIVLRNAGTEWIGTMFRDGLMHTLVKDQNIDVQAYRPSVVFINGEYWGIHNIREKANEHYLASHHNISPDSVNIINYWGLEPILGDVEEYHLLVAFIRQHSLNIQANYNYIKTKIDVDEFINYTLAEIFYDNTDWPDNNVRQWQPTLPDGKWRWILYDTDIGFGYRNRSSYSHYSLDDAIGIPDSGQIKPEWSTFLLRNLLLSEEFKYEFINRLADFTNSIFHSDNILNVIDKIKTTIEAEIPRHLARWDTSGINWYDNIAKVEEFASKRIPYIQNNFINRFMLQGIGKVSIEVNNPFAGVIKLNSLEISSFPWEGDYFKDVPIKITALPYPGYSFKCWYGVNDSLSNPTTLNLNTGISITAVFDSDSSRKHIVINEINYNSSSDFDTEDWIELYNAGLSDVNLSGWIFKDENDLNSFTFPAGNLLNKDDYLVLCRDTLKFSNHFSDVKNKIGNFDFGINNGGELIRLYDERNILIDSVSFDDKFPWPVEADGAGKTLELINPGFDNSIAENWTVSTIPGTPGKKNDAFTAVYNTDYNKNRTFNLSQNFPNPFNPITSIEYFLPASGKTSLKVYDVLGREVAVLKNEVQLGGNYTISFDGEDLPSGIYFYKLEYNMRIITKKMIIVK